MPPGAECSTPRFVRPCARIGAVTNRLLVGVFLAGVVVAAVVSALLVSIGERMGETHHP